jgi:putative ABC transport system substrate-binding protein
LQQTATTVPIVFANVVDPVGAGFVARLARPGGNATGFTPFEYSLRARTRIFESRNGEGIPSVTQRE